MHHRPINNKRFIAQPFMFVEQSEERSRSFLVHEGADSGSRTHDIRLETSDDNHFTISAVWCAERIASHL